MDELEIKGVTLKTAISQVKANPTDANLRVGLFRLFALTGQWDRAVTQLTAAMELKAENALYSKAFLACIACERFRAEVFAGKRMPMLIGEPEPWIPLMIQALEAPLPASKVKWWDQALELASPSAGKLNGEAFEWIADADSRLGPLFEAFIDGKYYWLPYSQLASLDFHTPVDLIETVWQSVEIEFENGGSKSAYVPARYPGSESHLDQQIVRGVKTEWQAIDDRYALGLGQKILTTDSGDFPILECQHIELSK
jgi:type VI secretion system protein ImpE